MISRSGSGKERTASVRRIEPRSTSGPRLHRWTRRENTFRATVRAPRAALSTYDRHPEKLREELTLVRIERHSGQFEELDVEASVLSSRQLEDSEARIGIDVQEGQACGQISSDTGVRLCGPSGL